MATNTRKSNGGRQMRLTAEKEEPDNLSRELCKLREDINDIKVSMDKLSKKSDIQEIVDKAIGDALEKSCRKLKEEIKKDVMEKAEQLVKLQNEEIQDRVAGIEIDIENLQRDVKNRDLKIAEMQDLLVYQQRKIKEATATAQRNEQYSRKYNVRINGIPETRNENLREIIPERIHQLTGVKLDGYYDMVAVHRLPSKSSPRPVIVKFFNNDIKAMVMRHKKELKRAGFSISHDITKANKELMDQVSENELIDYSWFYNGNVFGLCKETKKRVRFNLGDSIREVIENHKVITVESSTNTGHGQKH